MSLVSEALKKAQREASLRDAKQKGLPEQLVASSQPFRARGSGRNTGGLRFALVGLAIAALAATTTLVLRREPAARSEPSIEASEATRDERRPEMAAAAPEAAGADLAPSVAAGPSTSAGSPPATDAPTVAPLAPPSLEVLSSTSLVPAPEARTQDAVAPAPPARDGGRETRVVREAALADGTRIRLGGIAWSEAAPLAYLNGKLLGAGESIEGFRIARIERERVVLERAGERLVVALRP